VDILPRLPVARPRPATLSGRGAHLEATLPPGLVRRIGSLAAEIASSPYAILASTFARWLARLCGQPEVVLATSSANRARAAHEHVVGLVGDAVLVRVRPGEHDVAELARQYSADLYAALDHQDLPLSEVLGEVAPHLRERPFPTVLFTVVTTPPPALVLGDTETEVRGVIVPGLARTELYVRVTLDADAATICWEYATDLFTEEVVAAWHAELLAMLEEFVASGDVEELAASAELAERIIGTAA
jgi:non-ribosomal peptide synthetase component F